MFLQNAWSYPSASATSIPCLNKDIGKLPIFSYSPGARQVLAVI